MDGWRSSFGVFFSSEDRICEWYEREREMNIIISMVVGGIEMSWKYWEKERVRKKALGRS